MARQFVTSSHTSLLFLLKKSCQFMVDHFPDETVAIQELFKTLVFRGKRDVSLVLSCALGFCVIRKPLPGVTVSATGDTECVQTVSRGTEGGQVLSSPPLALLLHHWETQPQAVHCSV